MMFEEFSQEKMTASTVVAAVAIGLLVCVTAAIVALYWLGGSVTAVPSWAGTL